VPSFTGGTPINHPDRGEVVSYQPLMPGGGGEPVDPKRFLNVGGVAVAIQ
jgi:hypothetical protein